MAAIQRLSLVLGHPVYATAATLGVLLVFSGLGSWWSDRLPETRATRACNGVAGLAGLGATLLPVAGGLIGLPFLLRAFLASIGVEPIVVLPPSVPGSWRVPLGGDCIPGAPRRAASRW
jgi:hypothetical protein